MLFFGIIDTNNSNINNSLKTKKLRNMKINYSENDRIYPCMGRLLKS